MIVVVLAAVTLLLAALIVARGVVPEFRRRSELPKYRFLASLGIPGEAVSQVPSMSKEKK